MSDLSGDQLTQILNRLDEIERRLSQLEQPTAPVAAALPVFAPPVAATLGKASVPEPAAPARPALESKVGLTLLNRIGVVTLVLGIAFFFKWAADNNWVGPRGRVLLGVAAGVGALGVADWFWRKGQQIFAQGMTGTGLAILYIALYAAFDFYHLLSQPVTFVFMLAATSLAVALATRYQSAAIAALGFTGAYVIPLLLSDGKDRPWFLLFYLLAINIAASRLAAMRGWRQLELLSFSATILIFGYWVAFKGDKPENQWAATFGLLAFCGQRFRTSWPLLFLFTQMLCAIGAYFIWPISEPFTSLALTLAASGLAFAHLRRYPIIAATAFAAFWISVECWLWQQHTPHYLKAVETLGFLLFYAWTWWRYGVLHEEPNVRGMGIFALNGIFYFGIAYAALQRDYHAWLALLAVLIAVSYAALGAYCRRAEMVALGSGLCAAFVALAAAIQFSGFGMTVAWSIQAAAFVWIGVRLKNLGTVAVACGVFALALLHALVVDAWRYPPPAERLPTFAILAATLLLSAYWLSLFHRRLALVQFAAGHFALLTGLSLEVIRWGQRAVNPGEWLSRETIGISVLFALYAVVLVGIGVAARSLIHRIAGLFLTAIVIVKLYLFDVWQLGRLYQIAAFVILGVLLLATSFLYSRFKGFIGEWTREG